MTDQLSQLDSVEFDASNLWREEVYTDRKTGSIRVSIPVTVSGEDDATRAAEYHVQSTIMTGAGPLPVEGQVEGATCLQDAIDNFGPTTKQAVEDMIQRAQEMQREQASQIVTPGQAMGGGLGGMGAGPQGGSGGLII